LVRRDHVSSRRLLGYMSGPGRAPATDLVEWMTIVARACRTTGAPAPLPAGRLERWRDHEVRVAVGDRDRFFPPERLSEACRAVVGRDPIVVPGAGHLLVDEQPDVAVDLMADLL
jgi:pimeloyl-ACP methyl ester carboxylesterase